MMNLLEFASRYLAAQLSVPSSLPWDDLGPTQFFSSFSQKIYTLNQPSLKCALGMIMAFATFGGHVALLHPL